MSQDRSPRPEMPGETALDPAGVMDRVAGRALINARVHTMHDPDATAQAVAWDEDTLVAVGSDEDVVGIAKAEGWPIDDMRGRTVIPGFIDSHMHFLHVGIKRTRPDLRGAQSKDEALQRVATWLAAHPGDGPVTGEGWDEADWGPGEPPTREELDRVAGDRPLVLRRICGHTAVANSAALPTIRARWDDERVDTKTGVLLEEPSLYLNEVLPAEDDELDRAVDVACQVAHALGVTALGDYEQAPLRRALLRAAAQDRLTVRVQCSIYVQQLEDAIAEGFRTGRPVRHARRGEDRETGMEAAAAELEGAGMKQHLAGLGIRGANRAHPDGAGPDAVAIDPESMLRDGGLKVFLDGSLGGHTAHMLSPYDDHPDTSGRAIWDDEEVQRLFQRAHEHGIQIHAHAIGDGAIEQGLSAYEGLADGAPLDIAAYPAPGRDPLRATHRFEHYEIAHDDQVERTARLDIWASSQPNFVGEWSSKGGMYEERIGRRFQLNNRFRSFLGAGLPICFGSDGMPFGPLYGIQAAVDHPQASQRLRPAEAVYHYTAAGAQAMARDDIGVLEPGRKADLLILDVPDLDAAPPKQWVVKETIVGGTTVHRGGHAYVSDDDVPV